MNMETKINFRSRTELFREKKAKRKEKKKGTIPSVWKIFPFC